MGTLDKNEKYCVNWYIFCICLYYTDRKESLFGVEGIISSF
jgi:hypothetical protein